MAPAGRRPAAAALTLLLLLLAAGVVVLYTGGPSSTSTGTRRAVARLLLATPEPTTAYTATTTPHTAAVSAFSPSDHEALVSAAAGNFSDLLGVVILITDPIHNIPFLRMSLTLLGEHLAPYTPLRVCVRACMMGRGRTCVP